MGATIRRQPVVNNIPKNPDYYFQNIVNFGGMNISSNPFETEANTASDCYNVYVDEDNALSTRPRLSEKYDLMKYFDSGSKLIDIYNVHNGYLIQLTHDNEYYAESKSVRGISLYPQPSRFNKTWRNKGRFYMSRYNSTIDGYETYMFDESVDNFIEVNMRGLSSDELEIYGVWTDADDIAHCTFKQNDSYVSYIFDDYTNTWIQEPVRGLTAILGGEYFSAINVCVLSGAVYYLRSGENILMRYDKTSNRWYEISFDYAGDLRGAQVFATNDSFYHLLNGVLLKFVDGDWIEINHTKSSDLPILPNAGNDVFVWRNIPYTTIYNNSNYYFCRYDENNNIWRKTVNPLEEFLGRDDFPVKKDDIVGIIRDDLIRINVSNSNVYEINYASQKIEHPEYYSGDALLKSPTIDERFMSVHLPQDYRPDSAYLYFYEMKEGSLLYPVLITGDTPFEKCDIFEQNEIIYLASDKGYKQIKSNRISDVEGYIPTIKTGGDNRVPGTNYESLNLLSNKYKESYKWQGEYNLSELVTNNDTFEQKFITTELIDDLGDVTSYGLSTNNLMRMYFDETYPNCLFLTFNMLDVPDNTDYDLGFARTYKYDIISKETVLFSVVPKMFDYDSPIRNCELTLCTNSKGTAFICNRLDLSSVTSEYLTSGHWMYQNGEWTKLTNVSDHAQWITMNESATAFAWGMQGQETWDPDSVSKPKISIKFGRKENNGTWNTYTCDGGELGDPYFIRNEILHHIRLIDCIMDGDNYTTIRYRIEETSSDLLIPNTLYTFSTIRAISAESSDDTTIQIETIRLETGDDVGTVNVTDNGVVYNFQNSKNLNYWNGLETITLTSSDLDGNASHSLRPVMNNNIIYTSEGYFKNNESFIRLLYGSDIYYDENSHDKYVNNGIAISKQYMCCFYQGFDASQLQQPTKLHITKFNYTTEDDLIITKTFTEDYGDLYEYQKWLSRRDVMLNAKITARFRNERWFAYKNKTVRTINNDPTYIGYNTYNENGDSNEDITGMNQISDNVLMLYKPTKLFIVTYGEVANELYDYLYTETKSLEGNIPINAPIVTVLNELPTFVNYNGIYRLSQLENVQSSDRIAELLSEPVNPKWLKEPKDAIDSCKTINRLYWTYYVLNDVIEEDGDTFEISKVYLYDNRTNQWFYWELPIKTINLFVKDNKTTFVDDKGKIYQLETTDLINEYNPEITEYYDTGKKLIKWYWKSQILPLKTINYSKKLIDTTFILTDTDTQDNYGLNYQFTAYRRNANMTSETTISDDLNYVQSTTKRTLIPRFNFIQIKLSNVEDEDQFDNNKLKLVGLAMKYVLLNYNT